MNFIFPSLAAFAMVGMFWASRGPMMPWGLMATVNNTGPLSGLVLFEDRTN